MKMKRFLVFLLSIITANLSEGYQQCYHRHGRSISTSFCHKGRRSRGMLYFSEKDSEESLTRRSKVIAESSDDDESPKKSTDNLKPIERLRWISKLIKKEAAGLKDEEKEAFQEEWDEVGGRKSHPTITEIQKMEAAEREAAEKESKQQKGPKGSTDDDDNDAV